MVYKLNVFGIVWSFFVKFEIFMVKVIFFLVVCGYILFWNKLL